MSTITQSEASECGLACIAIASGMLGGQIELSSLRRLHPASIRGMTLAEIADVAGTLDLLGRAVRCELQELKNLSAPAILHWGLNHFVVLIKVRGANAVIHDPALGRRTVAFSEVSRQFTGIALELSRAPGFRRRKERSPLSLWSLFHWSPSLAAGLAQTLVLSILLQAYVLASPFYMQLAIDEAALKGDIGLLGALAIGFGLFSLFNVGAEALRGVAIQRVSAMLGWDMTVRLYRHMVRLPLPWFQRRRLADTLIRFESIEPVRQLLSNGLISSAIDGLLAATTLIMMIVFAWPLAIVAAAALLAYVVVRLVTMPLSIRLGSEALLAHVGEQGKRIETLRAIQTIKALGAEVEREGDWANRYAEVIRTAQTNAHANLAFKALQGVVESVAYVSIIYLGAKSVIDGKMTVGILFAFMAYRQQFQQRASALFETFINWRMLDLHSDRLADIVLTPTEKGIERPTIGHSAVDGCIELENLAFRYSAHEAWVFRNVNLRIEQGEFVAFVGPSGSGKSTLMKVLSGLYPPTHGEVRLDGRSLDSWGPRAVRRSLGVVLQDDELLSGSIAENVAFFDEETDMDRVRWCLDQAAISTEISAFPMGTETFVGDMGSALSGGQKQRILLARALYRQPRIMILDEATSHLDVNCEKAINHALKSLSVTRLVVAHRPETIAAADRIIVVADGRIVLDRKNKLDGATS